MISLYNRTEHYIGILFLNIPKLILLNNIQVYKNNLLENLNATKFTI